MSPSANVPEEYRGGRLFGVPIVGRVGERRKIRWMMAIIFACGLGFWVGAAAAAVAYFLWPQQMPIAFIFGFQGPCILVASTVSAALRVPVEQLPLLD